MIILTIQLSDHNWNQRRNQNIDVKPNRPYLGNLDLLIRNEIELLNRIKFEERRYYIEAEDGKAEIPKNSRCSKNELLSNPPRAGIEPAI
jgi:hypothetical protein